MSCELRQHRRRHGIRIQLLLQHHIMLTRRIECGRYQSFPCIRIVQPNEFSIGLVKCARHCKLMDTVEYPCANLLLIVHTPMSHIVIPQSA